MQRVLIIGKNRNPLMPCHPARAKELLGKGEATVLRHYLFTIILNYPIEPKNQPVTFKVALSSKTTDLALVIEFQSGKRYIWADELMNWCQKVKANLLRRGGKTRFDKSKHEENWLPPSLQSWVDNILTWLIRFPCTKAKQFKRIRGFQTDETIKAIVPSSKKISTYIEQVVAHTSGSFIKISVTNIVN